MHSAFLTVDGDGTESVPHDRAGASFDRVLVVDLDPQGNATSGFGIDRSALERTSYDALVDAYRSAALGVVRLSHLAKMRRQILLGGGAQVAATKAVALNPDLAEAHVAVAEVTARGPQSDWGSSVDSIDPSPRTALRCR